MLSPGLTLDKNRKKNHHRPKDSMKTLENMRLSSLKKLAEKANSNDQIEENSLNEDQQNYNNSDFCSSKNSKISFRGDSYTKLKYFPNIQRTESKVTFHFDIDSGLNDQSKFHQNQNQITSSNVKGNKDQYQSILKNKNHGQNLFSSYQSQEFYR